MHDRAKWPLPHQIILWVWTLPQYHDTSSSPNWKWVAKSLYTEQRYRRGRGPLFTMTTGSDTVPDAGLNYDRGSKKIDSRSPAGVQCRQHIATSGTDCGGICDKLWHFMCSWRKIWGHALINNFDSKCIIGTHQIKQAFKVLQQSPCTTYRMDLFVNLFFKILSYQNLNSHYKKRHISGILLGKCISNEHYICTYRGLIY